MVGFSIVYVSSPAVYPTFPMYSQTSEMETKTDAMEAILESKSTILTDVSHPNLRYIKTTFIYALECMYVIIYVYIFCFHKISVFGVQNIALQTSDFQDSTSIIMISQYIPTPLERDMG